MVNLGWLIGAGVVGGIVHKVRKNAEEEERRRNTPCRFLDGFSESDFKTMAVKSAKSIKRLSVSVEGPVIRGTVQSQSGISEWHFTVDFNDYGHISGRYWLKSGNSDSSIPKHYAENVVSLIRNFDPDDYDYEEIDDESLFSYSQPSTFLGSFCPFCGSRITASNPKFCSFCGKRLI